MLKAELKFVDKLPALIERKKYNIVKIWSMHWTFWDIHWSSGWTPYIYLHDQTDVWCSHVIYVLNWVRFTHVTISF